MTTPVATLVPPAPQTDPYLYGWRYVTRSAPMARSCAMRFL